MNDDDTYVSTAHTDQILVAIVLQNKENPWNVTIT